MNFNERMSEILVLKHTVKDTMKHLTESSDEDLNKFWLSEAEKYFEIGLMLLGKAQFEPLEEKDSENE